MATETLLLEKGARYRGLMAADDPTGVVATRSRFKAGLEGIGFKDVNVWMDPRDLPQEWPEKDKYEPTEMMVYAWAEGTWDGKDGQPIVKGGENWFVIWMYKIANAPGDEPTPDPNRFEQDVPHSKYAWIPVATVAAVCIGSVWLAASAAKEH